MNFGAKIREIAFWGLDTLTGSPVKKRYNEIKHCFEHGISDAQINQKLTTLFREACDNTAFYSKYKNATQLSDFPVMNKLMYKQHYEDFISQKYKDKKDNRTTSTSGSTGIPFTMIQNKAKINSIYALSTFLTGLDGYHVGMRQGIFKIVAGSATKPSKLSCIKQNMVAIDTIDATDQNLQNICDTIKDKKIELLIGHAGMYIALCKYLMKSHIDMTQTNVKAIITGSESLPEFYRENLQKIFDCPVNQFYGCMEMGNFGKQLTNQTDYYLDSSSFFFEILKLDEDIPAEDGELGRIVVTDYYNFAFPLIRCDTGDLGIMKRYKNEEGNWVSLLTTLNGRKTELCYDCKGNPVNHLIFWDILRLLENTMQYQVVQTDKAAFTVIINGSPSQDNVQLVISKMKNALGQEAKISIEYVDEIPVLSSGKRRWFEQRCDLYLNAMK